MNTQTKNLDVRSYQGLCVVHELFIDDLFTCFSTEGLSVTDVNLRSWGEEFEKSLNEQFGKKITHFTCSG